MSCDIRLGVKKISAIDAIVFQYLSSEGNRETIGEWSSGARGESPQAFVKLWFPTTDDPETSERWRAELAAGRLPQTSENED
jgi:hypothetical protein